MSDLLVARLRRKIVKRDARLAGAERRIKELEHQLAVAICKQDKLPREITRAVQEALCNVRMIPVLEFKSTKLTIKTEEGTE